MNKTFRSVWNASKQTYVAVAETVRTCGRPGTAAGTLSAITTAAALLTTLAAHAQTAALAPTALPTGGQVSAGQASIHSSGASLLIQQASDRAAINWQTFNVGKDAKVTFQQPDANSVTLNRVLSSDPSQIFGRISANGQVILTNPSGVYFGRGARVDVGGLVATTHSLTDADFMAGINHYERNGSSASVVNDGTLQAGLAGYIALLAPEVRNQGVVIAQLGMVGLAAGEVIDLHFDDHSRLTSLRVEPGELAALVENRHAVQAPGGLIVLSAQSLERLQGGVVRNFGQLEATGLQQGPAGRIVLSASNQVANAGTLDVSGAQGGQVSLQGDRIELQANSRINASGTEGGGSVLVGGGWQGSADPLVQATAQRTSTQAATSVMMASGATIDASATAHGDGGTVVLWSDLARADGITSAEGRVRVRGGAQSGQGGRVETSGHTVAIEAFSVDALAPKGRAGLWLIDPYDYTIGSTQAAAIGTALNTASVTVTTASNTTNYGSNGNSDSSGDITLSSAITKTGATGTTLTLQAARHIRLLDGANISATGGTLNLQLTADTALNGAGIIQLASNLATNGGYLKLGSNQSINIGGASTLVGGDVFFYGSNAQTLNTGGGQLDIHGETILSNTTGLSINTGSGDANFYGVLNSGNAYSFVRKTSGGSWDAGRTEARNGTLGASAVGDSYLVNVSSRLENAIAGIAAGYQGAWIGAYRPNSNSTTWVWADGPEASQQFFTQNGGGGTPTAGAYANFGAGEPNGKLNATRANTETVGQFFGNVGKWNDLVHTTTYSASQASQYGVLGFVRETNLASSTLSVTSTGNVSFAKAVGTSKTLANLAVTGNQITFNDALRLDATGATFTHSGPGQITGAVSGAGSLTKNGAGTLTLSANGSYTGATSINAGTLVLQNNAPTQTSSGFNGPGTLRIESAANAFTSAFSTSGWNFGSTLGALTLGKSANTANVTLAVATSIAGPVQINGGNIALNGALTATGSNTITLKSSGNVTQAAALDASSLLLLGGNVTLTNSSNTVDTLAASGVGNLSYTDANALTVSTVGATNGVSATGTVSIGTQSGDLTVARNVATTNATASALVLNADIAKPAGNAAGGNIGFSGSPTVSVGAGGTARLYSGSVTDSTGLTTLVGSGSGRFRYNSDEAAANYTTAPTPGLNAIYRQQPTVSISSDNKATTYGDTLPALTGSLTEGALVNGDTPRYAVAFAAGQKSSSGNYKAGSHTLTEVALSGLGYQVGIATGTLAVAQRGVALTGLLASNKTYDGGTNASVSSYGSIAGAVTGDTVTLNSGSATVSFDAGKNAGDNKAVTVSGLALVGTDGANYTIGSQSTTATITPKTLTLVAATGTKVYDATIGSTGTPTANGLIAGDSVSDLVQSYASKNAQGTNGSLLSVNTSYAVSDDNGGANYRVTLQTANGSITPKALTMSGLTTADKVYDATVIATVLGNAALVSASTAGSGTSGDGAPYIGDAVSLIGTASGAFNSKDVVTASTVSFSGLRLTGEQAGNYALTPHASAAHVITPAALTVKASDDAKLLTETDANDFNGVTYGGFQGGDTQSVLGGTLTVSRNNAGTENAGTYTAVLVPGGLSSSNYALSFVNGSFTIVPANQLLVRVANVNDTYGAASNYTVTQTKYLDSDGTTLVDLISDTTQLGNAVTIADPVGATASMTLTPLGASLSTAGLLSKGSYQLGATDFEGNANFSNLVVVGTHQVVAKGVTASAGSGVSKTYDGTTAMLGLTAGLTGKESADVVTVNGNGAFNSRNAGANRGYTVTDLALGGSDAENYYLTQGDSFTGSDGIINARQLVVAYSGVNKVYDGTASATVVTTDDRIVGDALTISRSASFADKHVANGRTVTVNGASMGGSDAANYTLSTTSGSTTASITRAPLVVSGIVGASKAYDRTTTATLNKTGVQMTGLVGGDDVSLGVTGAFADINSGFGKVVTLTSSYTGQDAGNYFITNQNAAVGSILRREVAVTATGVSKTYDGTTDMNNVTIGLGAVGGVPASGVMGGDTVTVSGTGSFSSANAGSGKSYTLADLQISGSSVGNYVLAGGNSSVSGNDGQILQKVLTIDGFRADNKAYDGSMAASVGVVGRLGGVVGTDTVSFSNTGASFNDANAGTGKTVTLAGIALAGANAANYTVAATATNTADITPKTLNITGLTADTKVYDGNSNVTIGSWGSIATGVTGESLALNHSTAGFVSPTAAIGKIVIATGYTLANGSGGGLASNYHLTSTSATTTADISTAALTLTGMSAQTKAYDGNAVATLIGGALDGVVGGDTVAFSGQTGAFADQNAGTAKPVTVSGLVLEGVDAGNYTVAQPTGLTGTITPKTLAITGLAAAGKLYDGTTAASIGNWGAVTTGVSVETLVVNHGSAGFSDKNAAADKIVTASGYTLADGSGGGLARNYQLASTSATTTANINARAISLTGLSAVGKVYNGDTVAMLTGGALDGLVNGDVVSFGSATGAFADRNVGSAKVVTVSGLTLTGADAGNYAMAQPTGLTADVMAKGISLNGMSAVGKVYNGNTVAMLTGGALDGLVDNDVVSFGGATGAFVDRHVGSARAVTVSGLKLTGADADNYAIAQPTGLTADITAKGISVTGMSAVGKVYNGDAVAMLTGGALDGLVNGDVVSFGSAIGAFVDSTVGGPKSVTVSGLQLTGADAGNYAIAQPAGLAADITRRAVTVIADAQQKPPSTSEPALTFQVEASSGNRGVLVGENLTGSLSRVIGEASGNYPILQGTMDDAGNPNYAIHYVGATFTVSGTPAVQPPPAPPGGAPAVQPPAPPAPPAGTPPGGTPDVQPPPAPPALPLPLALASLPIALEIASAPIPAFGIFLPAPKGDAGGGAGPGSIGITVALTLSPSAHQAGAVSVSVPKEMITSGAGFSFPLPAPLAQAAAAAGRVTAGTPEGGPLPGWLQFDPKQMLFMASAVPDGVFPFQVAVTIGDLRTIIVISERETAAPASR